MNPIWIYSRKFNFSIGITIDQKSVAAKYIHKRECMNRFETQKN